MHDCFESALMAQFLALQPAPDTENPPPPTLPPELVREQLRPETEHQSEAI